MKLAKWGNSYAVRIPKKLVEEYELLEGLVIEREEEGILLKPSNKQQLRELLKDIKPQEEVDWGASRGKEVW